MVSVRTALDAGAANSSTPALRAGEPRWETFHARTRDRDPRRVLLAACDLFGSGEDRPAIDLGCGAGVDVLALLARGWSVTAIDRDPAACQAGAWVAGAGCKERERLLHDPFRSGAVQAGVGHDPVGEPGEHPGGDQVP
jgi:SAM-dependent methyltransferase